MFAKKTHLFTDELDFLEYHISAYRVKTDGKKCDKILSWPILQSFYNVHTFLDLVYFLDKFLSKLANYF